MVVIHENRGLTDLLSGMAPGGGRTSDFVSGDPAREAISSLPPDQVSADLNAVADYVGKLLPSVRPLPAEIDREIARIKLATLGVASDSLTLEQEELRHRW